MNFSSTDIGIFVAYIIAIMAYGIYVSNKEKAKTSKDYFLASGALPWWAVGGSLIASNISTEQILGMNGSGFELGLAIATYEMMAAATLLIVAKFFLPIFLEKKIFTMPQFLEERFDNRVRSGLAVFWILLFVFVNITSVLYLGGLAIQNILDVPLMYGIIGLVLYSATFSIFGGLKAVVWTDVIQVIVLVVGGLMATYFILTEVGGGFFSGLAALVERAPDRFDMIFTTSDTFIDISTGDEKSAYGLLPGLSVLLGGMWIANIYYWGNNQYIIQRALAAKNIKEAQKGVAFAAFLKIFMPLIVVIPGIAAFVLGADIVKADEAFPWVLNNYVGNGLKGLVFAALVAAIGSSISSMVNSTSTIFTLDIFKQIRPETNEKGLVRTGQISAAVALVIGATVAPLLGNLGQVFQYIQEYTGFISPGVVAVFLFGMFWKRATANAALAVVLLSIPFSWSMKFFFPDFPFLDRMGLAFLLLSTILIVISLLENEKKDKATEDKPYRWGLIIAIIAISTISGFKLMVEAGGVNVIGILIVGLSIIASVLLLTDKRRNDKKAIHFSSNLFRTDQTFNISALLVFGMLVAIYAIFW